MGGIEGIDYFANWAKCGPNCIYFYKLHLYFAFPPLEFRQFRMILGSCLMSLDEIVEDPENCRTGYTLQIVLGELSGLFHVVRPWEHQNRCCGNPGIDW